MKESRKFHSGQVVKVQSRLGFLGRFVIMGKVFVSDDHPLSEAHQGEALYLLYRIGVEMICPESWLVPLPLEATATHFVHGEVLETAAKRQSSTFRPIVQN